MAKLEKAEAALGSIDPKGCVLVYDPEGGEFCELSEGGRDFLQALQSAGSLGVILEAAERAGAETSGLEAFAKELYQAGLLHEPRVKKDHSSLSATTDPELQKV